MIVAESGPDALKKIEGHVLNLAILDVNMPGWDGVRVAEAARNLNHKVIVMLMTAESEMYHYANLADCGAVAVFRKPVQLDKITDFLRSALGQADAA